VNIQRLDAAFGSAALHRYLSLPWKPRRLRSHPTPVQGPDHHVRQSRRTIIPTRQLFTTLATIDRFLPQQRTRCDLLGPKRQQMFCREHTCGRGVDWPYYTGVIPASEQMTMSGPTTTSSGARRLHLSLLADIIRTPGKPICIQRTQDRMTLTRSTLARRGAVLCTRCCLPNRTHRGETRDPGTPHHLPQPSPMTECASLPLLACRSMAGQL
jgi:hypothetical protein